MSPSAITVVVAACRSERNLADEAALLQMRDLAAADHDAGTAGADEEYSFKRLVLLGERRTLGEIDKPASIEQTRDL